MLFYFWEGFKTIISPSGKCPVLFHDELFSLEFTNIHIIDISHPIFIFDVLEYLYYDHVIITLYVIIVSMNRLYVLDSNLSTFKSNSPKMY